MKDRPQTTVNLLKDIEIDIKDKNKNFKTIEQIICELEEYTNKNKNK